MVPEIPRSENCMKKGKKRKKRCHVFSKLKHVKVTAHISLHMGLYRVIKFWLSSFRQHQNTGHIYTFLQDKLLRNTADVLCFRKPFLLQKQTKVTIYVGLQNAKLFKSTKTIYHEWQHKFLFLITHTEIKSYFSHTHKSECHLEVLHCFICSILHGNSE